MEHKKDIGALLKERLDAAEKAPKQTLWERLDNSLEEREKKRRRAAWFWYGGAGILLALLLLGSIFMTSNSTDLDTSTPKVATEENTSEIETEIENETIIDSENKNDTNVENLANDNLGTQDEAEISATNGTKVDGLNSPETNSNSTTDTNATTGKNTTTKKGNKTNKDPMAEDGFTIITTHEYYNSDLDTTTISHSKQKIDSLVAANKRRMAIKDSIARKRATDSIKLNEARKDSIPE